VFTEEYQKSLSEKEETINQDTAKLDSQNVITLEQLTDEEKETLPQVLSEIDSSDVMVQVKSLYNEGKYDEAYRIADDLRQKKPDFGLAYFVLGTIEIRKEHYDKGEELLNRAVQLGLPDDDMAWAFYNLGKSSLQKKDYKKVREFLEKTIKLKPNNMEESKKVIDLFNDLLDDVQEKKGNDKEEWGGNGRKDGSKNPDYF
jgi:tetratricopeptide (TPR) repeat protein